jgi:hypothetical protein
MSNVKQDMSVQQYFISNPYCFVLYRSYMFRPNKPLSGPQWMPHTNPVTVCCMCTNSLMADCDDSVTLSTNNSFLYRQMCVTPMCLDIWQLTSDCHKAAALLTGISEGRYLFESWLSPRLLEYNSTWRCTAPLTPTQNPKFGQENSFRNTYNQYPLH